jgi:uncharacterized membrane protein
MVVSGAVIFTMGVAFLLNGTWPLIGFLGLDLALLYWAIRVILRRGRAFEHLHLTRSAFCIRRVDTSGRAEEIRLRSHGVAHRVGLWLSPIERLTLAEAIEDALAVLHSPPSQTRTPRES